MAEVAAVDGGEGRGFDFSSTDEEDDVSIGSREGKLSEG